MSGFSNSIIGGAQKLIRKAIQSPKYVPGSAGWSINKDGTAEFSAATFRGSIIVQSDAQGIFVYAGTPAAGNLIVSIASVTGTDPFGNSYRAGINVFTINQVSNATVSLNNGIIEFIDPTASANADIQALPAANNADTPTLSLGSPAGSGDGFAATYSEIIMSGMSQDGTHAASILLTGANAITGTQLPTKVEVNGTLSGSGIAGSVSVSFTALTSYTVAVTFPEAFATVPAVMVNINSGSGVAAHWDARAEGISTTGFTLFVFAPSGGAAQTWASIPVQWIAVGT